MHVTVHYNYWLTHCSPLPVTCNRSVAWPCGGESCTVELMGKTEYIPPSPDQTVFTRTGRHLVIHNYRIVWKICGSWVSFEKGSEGKILMTVSEASMTNHKFYDTVCSPNGSILSLDYVVLYLWLTKFSSISVCDLLHVKIMWHFMAVLLADLH